MRAVVNVATGSYVKGQARLTETLTRMKEDHYCVWRDPLPPGSPTHAEIPYGFKAYALKAAIEAGATTLLWADACILPIAPLGPLWERIERDGYWISNNGFTNYEWTADSAYSDLFHGVEDMPESVRAVNRDIKHVVATAFGISMEHPTGRAIFEEYYRLASETKAFCGPWANANYLGDGWPYAENPPRLMPCGPSDVRGHRHDQTALSVIAWRLGCQLTNAPDIFAYAGGATDKTILVADATYHG